MASGKIAVKDAYYAAGFNLTGFDTSFTFQRVGKICFITYNGAASNLAKGELTFSEVIPQRYRPSQTTIIGSDNSSAKVLLVLYSNGTISGYNYEASAITASTSCRFGTTSYIAYN